MIPVILAATLFHDVPVADFARRKVTHVCTTGTVTLKKREADKDWHLRISDGKAFIVAEIVPELPFDPPAKGASVRVCGIRRYDDAPGHGWWEVHPVTRPIREVVSANIR